MTKYKEMVIYKIYIIMFIFIELDKNKDVLEKLTDNYLTL